MRRGSGVRCDTSAPHPPFPPESDKRKGIRKVDMATWKREFKLPWRKAGLLTSMIKWTRTSRLSIKISLSGDQVLDEPASGH